MGIFNWLRRENFVLPPEEYQIKLVKEIEEKFEIIAISKSDLCKKNNKELQKSIQSTTGKNPLIFSSILTFKYSALIQKSFNIHTTNTYFSR